jgi:hypothetical protein
LDGAAADAADAADATGGECQPGENANRVAAEQLRSWQCQGPPAPPASTPPPIVSCDAGDDSVQLSLALADAPVCRRVRLRSGRCLYADPTTPLPTGRPRRQGAKVVCDDPTTWPEPIEQWSTQWSTDDPQYGHVQLQAWSGLHPIPQQHAQRGARTQPPARPLVRGTLLRREVGHLPRPTKHPAPLWFWWWGPAPPDLAVVWLADGARFSIEHRFRFFKQTLKWTTPQWTTLKWMTPQWRRPEAAERWTWLLLLAFVQLRLARDQVADVR